MLRLITIIWLLFMLILSHIGGQASSEESRWLSSMTGVKESVLRRAAHVVVYAVLATLTMLAWSAEPLWLKAVVLGAIAVIDETSKALPCFQGRHCSLWPDMVLNLVGVVGGVLIGGLVLKIV